MTTTFAGVNGKIKTAPKAPPEKKRSLPAWKVIL